MNEYVNKIIKHAHDEWLLAIDSIEDAIFIHDGEFRILRCNRAYQQYAKLPFKKIIGQEYFKVFPKLGAPLQSCINSLKNSATKGGDEEELEVNGMMLRSRVYPIKGKKGKYLYSIHTLENITEYRKLEKTLNTSELNFKAIFEGASDGILIADTINKKFTHANEKICKMLGYTLEEILSLSVKDIHPQKDYDYVLREFKKQLKGEIELATEVPVVRKDDTVFFADINSFPLIISEKKYLVGFFRDVTTRKISEETLNRANRALRTLSAVNQTLIHAKSEKELLQKVTDVVVNTQDGGYSFAMVCYKEENNEENIVPITWSGAYKNFFWEEHTDWDEALKEKLPICLAIDTSKTQICRDIENECKLKPWRDAALARGYLSNIALPLYRDKKSFGAISIYSSEVKSFDDNEVKLLEELADDLAYGIINLRMHAEHEKQTLLFKESLEQSIQAIAATIESRDPYTAGHQKRVAELATAIAKEMKLPQKQVRGIHFAAIIHDLGKINIPAEILSKPSKLNEFEYKLIQMHPQAGYDILKNIQFPWPIADIILQHHEKLDGSGYPKGLKGDKILLESKIITVADIVEAISSHRPYRASLGIEYALNEIMRGRGIQYDEQVVDTCLKLFAEKGFVFSKVA